MSPDERPKKILGATKDEQAIVERAWELGKALEHPQSASLRDALVLLIELLNERHRHRQGSGLWEFPLEEE